MTAREVVFLAAQHGVNLTVAGDALRVEPLPTCRGIPDGLVDELRQHKLAIIEILLTPNAHGACAECGADTENILTTAKRESWMCATCWEDRHGARWVAV